MALKKEQKQTIIEKYGKDVHDTGSCAVQVALLTKRIQELTEHFNTHVKDHHSRRGLLKLVGQRRHLLDFMIRTNLERYRELIKELGIRR